jgi:hypothetical protein
MVLTQPKHLLDAFAHRLLCVALVASYEGFYGTAPTVDRVASEVREDASLPKLIDKLVHVIATIGAQRGAGWQVCNPPALGRRRARRRVVAALLATEVKIIPLMIIIRGTSSADVESVRNHADNM